MKKMVGGAAVAVIAFAVYWYEYRPSQIRTTCAETSKSHAAKIAKARAQAGVYTGLTKEQLDEGWFASDDQERAYQDCLRTSGLRGPRDNL